MRLIAIALAAAMTAACQTPCPAPQTGARVAHFACEDGSRLRVTFTTSPDAAVVEQEGYTPLTLSARISGSGYRYVESVGDDGAELRARGMSAAWLRPGAVETVCTETAP